MHLHRSVRAGRDLILRPALLLLLIAALTLAACGGSNTDDPASAATATTAPAAPTAAPTSAPVVTEAPAEAEAEDEAAEDEAEATDTSATDSSAASSEAQTFVIDPEQSEARFIIDEVLFGNPNTVTGTTNEVSGEIVIDVTTPAQSSVGAITINARALATDNRFRNRSISRMILQTNRDEYQFITFTPTSITGLPDSVAVGDTFTFQVMGDLQIRDAIQPTTFEVTVTADAETQISGLAQAQVLRADFELTIPDVDGVADVTEEVMLELEFVATATE